MYLRTSDPARRPGIAPMPYTKQILTWPVRWWRVGSIPSKDSLATPLYLSSMLFIYGADAGIGLLNGFTLHPENTNVKF